MDFSQVSRFTIPQGEVYRIIDSSNRILWERKLENEYDDCITFAIAPITTEDSELSSFTLTATSKTWDGTLYYSLDHNAWNVWDGSAITSGTKKRIYLRGKNTALASDSSTGPQFRLSVGAECHGNVMTLLDYEDPESNIPTNAFVRLFDGCTKLIHAPEVPGVILSPSCCAYMFYGCTGLKWAPALPATTMSTSSYACMFTGCTSLVEPPKLPSMELEKTCYRAMFNNCTSLKHPPELPATTLAQNCYYQMFLGCTSLDRPVNLPATTLVNGCYYQMFANCSNIKVNTSGAGDDFRIPPTGTGLTASRATSNMLANTGGSFTSDPIVNTTYKTDCPYSIYWYLDGRLVGVTEDTGIATWGFESIKIVDGTKIQITDTTTTGESYLFDYGVSIASVTHVPVDDTNCGVTYVYAIASKPETCIGTWQFCEGDALKYVSHRLYLDFTSGNNVLYHSLDGSILNGAVYYCGDGGNDQTWNMGFWANDNYRTITIRDGEDIYSQYALDWLKSTATRISQQEAYQWQKSHTMPKPPKSLAASKLLLTLPTNALQVT